MLVTLKVSKVKKRERKMIKEMRFLLKMYFCM